jgi:hypothetical protein
MQRFLYYDELLTLSVCDQLIPSQLYARWELIQYTVTYEEYNIDDQIKMHRSDGALSITYYNFPTSYNYILEGFNLESGNNYTLNDPEAYGYVFDHWDPNNLIIFNSTGNRIYTSYWRLASKAVQFDLQGGTGNVPDQSGYYTKNYPEMDIEEVISPHKVGYDFAGFYSGVDGAGNQFYDSNLKCVYQYTINSIEPITLYAYWTPKAYTVSIKTFKEDENLIFTINYNDEFPNLITKFPDKELPEHRNGYDFLGYFSVVSGERYYDENLNWNGKIFNLLTNLTLESHWQIKEYTITYVIDVAYKINESNVIYKDRDTKQTVAKKTKYTVEDASYKLPIPICAPYNFDKWYLFAYEPGMEAVVLNFQEYKENTEPVPIIVYGKWSDVIFIGSKISNNIVDFSVENNKTYDFNVSIIDALNNKINENLGSVRYINITIPNSVSNVTFINSDINSDQTFNNFKVIIAYSGNADNLNINFINLRLKAPENSDLIGNALTYLQNRRKVTIKFVNNISMTAGEWTASNTNTMGYSCINYNNDLTILTELDSSIDNRLGNSKVQLLGGNGYSGTKTPATPTVLGQTGAVGSPGSNEGKQGGQGVTGLKGESGKNGGSAIVATNINFVLSSRTAIYLYGGNGGTGAKGGKGGKGGTGGAGQNYKNIFIWAGNGGKGGIGGVGGEGGDYGAGNRAIDARSYNNVAGINIVNGVRGGFYLPLDFNGGDGGEGGDGGLGGIANNDSRKASGPKGEQGPMGPNGNILTLSRGNYWS